MEVLMVLIGLAFLVWTLWIYGEALREKEHNWRILHAFSGFVCGKAYVLVEVAWSMCSE